MSGRHHQPHNGRAAFCSSPIPMLEAGRKCIKPTVFAHALDLLLSDWELVMEP